MNHYGRYPKSGLYYVYTAGGTAPESTLTPGETGGAPGTATDEVGSAPGATSSDVSGAVGAAVGGISTGADDTGEAKSPAAAVPEAAAESVLVAVTVSVSAKPPPNGGN